MTSEEALVQKHAELKIVLVGKVGAGKTSVMNTLLRSSGDKERPVSECPSATETCQVEKVRIREQNLVLVDTPGLCNPLTEDDEEVFMEIRKSAQLAAPGPLVFLFVLTLDRFTEEEQNMVKDFNKHFGKEAQYMMVLFTGGDRLQKKGKNIVKFIEGNSELKKFVDDCNCGYHVIDNTDRSPRQVTELLRKINSKVQNQFREAEKEVLRKRITFSVNASALVGAALGAAVYHLVGSPNGISGGLAVGGAVGGVLGCAGIVIAERARAKRCVLQ